MAWTATINLDSTTPYTGTITAVFYSGLTTQFTYSERLISADKSISVFVTNAKAALKDFQSTNTSKTTLENQITTALNS